MYTTYLKDAIRILLGRFMVAALGLTSSFGSNPSGDVVRFSFKESCSDAVNHNVYNKIDM